MRPTRAPVLVVLVLVGGAVSYLVLRLVYDSLPPLTATGPVALVVLGIIEAAVGSTIRARLAGRPKTRPIMPIAVARVAALAKASSAVGALVAGGYLGVIGYTAPRTEHPAPSHDLAVGIAGALAALVLVACALVLERSCRAPRVPPGDDPPPG